MTANMSPDNISEKMGLFDIGGMLLMVSMPVLSLSLRLSAKLIGYSERDSKKHQG